MSFKPRFSAATLFISGALALCAACEPLVTPTPPADTAAPPTAAPTAAANPTPTDCPTAWSWATGPGSPDFDEVLARSLTEGGLTVRSVASSAFGENNLCNGLFHAMALDITVELSVADVPGEDALAETSTMIVKQAQDALPISGVPNLGRATVRFVAPEATWECITTSGGAECRAAP